MSSSSPTISQPAATKTVRRLFPQGTRLHDNLTGWIFISPAVFLIAVFGFFPIIYAVYMSLHRWRLRKGGFLGLDNYTRIIGDWWGVFLFVIGFIVLFTAFTLWNEAFKSNFHAKSSPYIKALIRIPGKYASAFMMVSGGGLLALYALYKVFNFEDGTNIHTSGTLPVAFGLLIGGVILFFASRTLWDLAQKLDEPGTIIKVIGAFIVMGLGMYLISIGWVYMIGAGDDDFLTGITITFWYAFMAVPTELCFGLVLSYILFQNIKGKQWYRMVFFLPYVAPDVAMAVVFGIVFSSRETALANQVLDTLGLPAQRWVSEPNPLLNTVFGLHLEGFLAGPSMALFSIALLGIWKYTGYNAVIFLAGLGSIPRDLYEAAKVDGATEWNLFRNITLPLLSPVTFYLAILAFIGTFKSFNSIYVLRLPQALGTVDVASIAIFDRFFKTSQYGLATAEAIILFFLILGMTQTFRNVFEKRVFYG